MIRERNRGTVKSSVRAKSARAGKAGSEGGAGNLRRGKGGRAGKAGGSPGEAETTRLREDSKRIANWKRWGPYLADRQWGTVREDYSADGNCWAYFPHDHARSRVYRWGEDGLLGITDRECRLCFGLALWNGKDSILKERLFGLTNSEGNHGEDVKEHYFYIDSTPTHSYMKGLYKYPQAAFPYEQLVAENLGRGQAQPEYEIHDTGIFNDGRYFDVFAEYAKAGPSDICIQITVANRGPESAALHLLPTLWYRNTWASGCTHEGCTAKPTIRRISETAVEASHVSLGQFYLEAEGAPGQAVPEWLFTENETNNLRLYGTGNTSPYVKDAFHQFVVEGKADAVSSEGVGTKAAVHYSFEIPPGGEVKVRLRLFAEDEAPRSAFGRGFEQVFKARMREADEFYRQVIPQGLADEQKTISRQAYAGLLWNKQFYHYVIKDWLDGDPNMPPPPESRKQGRNADWPHLFNRDVISMPDKWEYPWYGAWDLAFHMVPMARIDPEFAKGQLLLFLREWYMHPSGELPAYEFNFDDVNPPVHAWACWRVYKITGRRGQRDVAFLERAFQKLLLNFTWWVNRKDVQGKHIFAGGFLGLDNLGVFDRSGPLPAGTYREQADGTAWMAFYCATMLSMAIELAQHNRVYEDIASKFFEHFVHITDAINSLGGKGLWDEQDGFYYDQMHTNGQAQQMRLRSLVGLIPLLAVEVADEKVIGKLPGFAKRMRWFLENRQDLSRHISYMVAGRADGQNRYLLAIPSRERLERVLRYMLDEKEFLSPFGVRSLSRIYKDDPFVVNLSGQEHRVAYMPGESDNRMFGGNSNWRGPVWFPVNYLLIEALERYHHFYGEDLRVECPTGSGQRMNLKQVAEELSSRLMRIFLPDAGGVRPAQQHLPMSVRDPHWRDYVLFYECFDGDNGRGVGASHQTGWTSLVAKMLEDSRRASTCEEAAEPGPSWREEQPVCAATKRPACKGQPARASQPAGRTSGKRAGAKGKTRRRQPASSRR